MSLSYNKLWKLLIDKNIKKTDLSKIADVSRSTITKLVNGENVQTDVLVRICKALNCELGDIVEISKEEE